MNPDFNILAGLFLERPTKRRIISIPEYAETTIIPAGKYRGRRFSHTRAPYLREPLQCLSPESPIQEVRLMFPAQTGKSTIGEIATIFYTVEYPSEILYVTSDERAGAKWMMRRYEPRARAAGVVFRSGGESKISRRTGDTVLSKEFPGGNIDVASALSVSQLASETKRIVIADETDRWRLILGADGLTWDQMAARAQAWGDEKKILAMSTPTIATLSIIASLYEEGDQRKYYVPCPHCGTMQLLDFEAGRGFGLHWEYKNGKVDKRSIELLCESSTCRKGIRETIKGQLLNGGEWRATAIPADDTIASFHINGLYSPFITWHAMARAWVESREDILKRQSFENLKMGRPYMERGSRPKVSRVIENRGVYKSETVPDGVLYLVSGIDVQEGSEASEEGARLEMTVLGIGKQNRTWVIEHRVFDGPVFDPYGGAWAKMNMYMIEKWQKNAYRRCDGFGFVPFMCFVDSGSGKVTDVVYQYCRECVNIFPSKGFSQLKQRKTERPDDITGKTIRYRPVKIGDGTLYEINTNYYKDSIYRRLHIERQDTYPQRGGFIEFPHDLPESYFEQLTAEERRIDGTFYNPGGRRNEALDCFVMCLCAADVWLWSEMLNYRAAMKGKLNQNQLLDINLMYVLDIIEKSTARKTAALDVERR